MDNVALDSKPLKRYIETRQMGKSGRFQLCSAICKILSIKDTTMMKVSVTSNGVIILEPLHSKISDK